MSNEATEELEELNDTLQMYLADRCVTLTDGDLDALTHLTHAAIGRACTAPGSLTLALIVDETSGVTYLPWSDPHTGVVGFEATHPDGPTERVYLNPSTGSDDGVPTVFLYAGTGDPAQDGAIVHVVPFR